MADAAGEPPEVDDATISISDAIERLRSASKLDAPRVLARMLDHLDASGRFALLKLALGELRVGINARLAKQALAQAFGLEVEAVEEVWHGLKPPFAELFDWAEGRADQPSARDIPVFRPFMLAHPLDETRVSLDDYAAEWKWDGIRVQLVHAGGETRLYSRTGDDISGKLSRCRRGVRDQGVLDGELLVRGSDQGSADLHGGAAASFNALQQRLGRKNVSAKDARRVSRLRPALRHPVRRRGGSARAAVDRAARAARALCRASSTPSGSTSRS